MDVADGYVTFVRHSQDMLREKVNEEVYVERLFDVSKPFCLIEILFVKREQEQCCILSGIFSWQETEHFSCECFFIFPPRLNKPWGIFVFSLI